MAGRGEVPFTVGDAHPSRDDLLNSNLCPPVELGMSLPPFPSFSGLKPGELHVYTIEECGSCKQKTKRDFKTGDYVAGQAGICEKCQGKKMIILIYGEKVTPR